MGECYAIVLAAGRGERFGNEYKCLTPLFGRPILAYAIQPFQDSGKVDRIIVATRQEHFGDIGHLIENYGFSKVVQIVEGGDKRQDSVYNAISRIKTADYILVHDGARPLASKELVEKTLAAAIDHGAAVAAVRAKDTVKQGDAFVEKTIPRENIWLAQTPQAFRFDILQHAHNQARKMGLYTTDDASLVELTGWPVAIVPGEYSNIKVTTPDDILIVTALVRKEHEKN